MRVELYFPSPIKDGKRTVCETFDRSRVPELTGSRASSSKALNMNPVEVEHLDRIVPSVQNYNIVAFNDQVQLNAEHIGSVGPDISRAPEGCNNLPLRQQAVPDT